MEATKGRKDYFLVNPNIPKFASFAFEFPMEGHIAAMFGDDKSGYFEKGMRNYIESTFGEEPTANYNESALNYNELFMGFVMEYDMIMNEKYHFPVANRIAFEKHKRKYYSTSGILICRPDYGEGISATFKLLGGGLNPTGDHNHDDCGTYQIMLNGTIVAGDPGGPDYYEGDWTARYNRTIFNSYGHPLPVINGQLQVRNMVYNLKEPRPKVLNKIFTDEMDFISFELKHAYNNSKLVSLIRNNRYTRTIGKQSVVIEDIVEFIEPTKFETAVTSRNAIWIEEKKILRELTGKFVISNITLNVRVISENEFEHKNEILTSNGVSFTRIGNFCYGNLQLVLINCIISHH